MRRDYEQGPNNPRLFACERCYRPLNSFERYTTNHGEDTLCYACWCALTKQGALTPNQRRGKEE